MDETDKMEESSAAANTASEQNEQKDNNDPTAVTKSSEEESMQSKKRLDPKCLLFAFVVMVAVVGVVVGVVVHRNAKRRNDDPNNPCDNHYYIGIDLLKLDIGRFMKGSDYIEYYKYAESNSIEEGEEPLAFQVCFNLKEDSTELCNVDFVLYPNTYDLEQISNATEVEYDVSRWLNNVDIFCINNGFDDDPCTVDYYNDVQGVHVTIMTNTTKQVLFNETRQANWSYCGQEPGSVWCGDSNETDGMRECTSVKMKWTL